MAEIPDLSKLNSKPAEDPEDEHEHKGISAKTAFLVVIDTQGNIQISADLMTAPNIVMQHPPSTDEIYTTAALIMRDISNQQTAAMVQQALLHMGAAMQAQVQNEQIRHRLNLK